MSNKKLKTVDLEKGKKYKTLQGQVIEAGDLITDEDSAKFGYRKIWVIEGKKKEARAAKPETEFLPYTEEDELETLPSKKSDKGGKKEKKEKKGSELFFAQVRRSGRKIVLTHFSYSSGLVSCAANSKWFSSRMPRSATAVSPTTAGFRSYPSRSRRSPGTTPPT